MNTTKKNINTRLVKISNKNKKSIQFLYFDEALVCRQVAFCRFFNHRAVRIQLWLVICGCTMGVSRHTFRFNDCPDFRDILDTMLKPKMVVAN